MAAKRLSPGVYEVNGKRVNAKNEAEALKMAGGGNKQQNKAGGGGKAPAQKNILPKNTNMKTVPGAIEAERTVGDFEAQQGIRYANPNQSGPFGSRTVDENGNIVDSLSPEGDVIRRQDDELSKYGRDIAKELGNQYNIGAGFNPQLAKRTSDGDMNADRARIENEVFGRLTRDLDQRQGRDTDAAKQELYNKGIPFSADPNSRYQQELGTLTKRYDDQRLDARGQAAMFGGEEMSRSFGMNEQLIANQLSQQQGIRNQQIGELGNFANFGQGLRVPNMGPVQGVQYNLPSPTDIYGQQKQIELANKQLNMKGGGGGGQPQGGAPATNSPFNNTLPPGVAMNQG